MGGADSLCKIPALKTYNETRVSFSGCSLWYCESSSPNTVLLIIREKMLPSTTAPTCSGEAQGPPTKRVWPELHCGRTSPNAELLLRETAELTQARGSKALKSTLDHSSCFLLLQLLILTYQKSLSIILFSTISPCCSLRRIFLLFKDGFVFWCPHLRYSGW